MKTQPLFDLNVNINYGNFDNKTDKPECGNCVNCDIITHATPEDGTKLYCYKLMILVSTNYYCQQHRFK